MIFRNIGFGDWHMPEPRPSERACYHKHNDIAANNGLFFKAESSVCEQLAGTKHPAIIAVLSSVCETCSDEIRPPQKLGLHAACAPTIESTRKRGIYNTLLETCQTILSKLGIKPPRMTFEPPIATAESLWNK